MFSTCIKLFSCELSVLFLLCKDERPTAVPLEQSIFADQMVFSSAEGWLCYRNTPTIPCPITTLPYPHHSPFFSSLKTKVLSSAFSQSFNNRWILKEFTRSNVSIIFRQKWVFITLQFHETIHLTMYIYGSFVLYTYHIRLQPSFYCSLSLVKYVNVRYVKFSLYST